MTGRQFVWVLCPLLGVVLMLEVARTHRWWRASQAAAIVKDVTIAASQRGRLSRQLLQHNLELLRVSEPLAPVEVALPIARGGLYLLLDRPEAAIRAYHRALEIEPRGEIYVHIGRAHLKMGDRASAEEAFRVAMVLDHTQRKRVRGFVTQAVRRGMKPPDPAAEPSDETIKDSATGARTMEGNDMTEKSETENE